MNRRNSLIVVLGQSLSIQLDRLRATLDGLSQRLREAVARAVGETVGGAVRHTLHVALADSSLGEEEFDRSPSPRYATRLRGRSVRSSLPGASHPGTPTRDGRTKDVLRT